MNFEAIITNALNNGNLYSKDYFLKSYEEFRKIGLKLIFIHNDFENNELYKKLDSLQKLVIKIKINEIKKIYSFHQKNNKDIIKNNDILIMYKFNKWYDNLKNLNIDKYFHTNNDRIHKIKPYYKKNFKNFKK